MPSATRRYDLLIVEDDDTDRRLYTKLMARRGAGVFVIEEAADCAAGLLALRARKFDCILLDFNLPDANGFEFLTDAAANGELECAVVLITGHGNEAIAVETMKRGVQDYIAKDKVNEDSLWRAITRAVAQHELAQRLANSLRDLTEMNAALEHEIATREAAEVELRAAKETAEQANQAKTRFVAMVTHELRTPLNGVLGYAQLLRVEGGLSARQDAHVVAMMHAGQHLLGLIEQVLDFTSIESGRLTLQAVTVSIRDLAAKCIALIEPLAVQRALALRTSITHAAPRQILTDPSRLRQILLNLLGNAVKYTAAGSVELRLLAGATPGGLRVEVVDTGRGIDEGHVDCLFQDFERLGAANSVEGAGLGLAIAARIIDMMRGTIGYTANPAGGSVFWLDIPTADPGQLSLSEAAQHPPPPSNRRVLLVDDIAMNRDVIGAFLCAGGYSVVSAESGQDAVLLASVQTFDLILMDVRMPEIDGLEATRRIRALPPPRGQIPILALTAYALPEQAAQCRQAGMDGRIAKPVEYSMLMDAVADEIAGTSAGWSESCFSPSLPEVNYEPQSLLQIDHETLNKTLSFFAPDDVPANLHSLRLRTEQMLRLLDQSAVPSALTEVAHALGAAAGMFGFAALSAAARNFELAAANDAPEANALADHLRAETCTALGALAELMSERGMLPS